MKKILCLFDYGPDCHTGFATVSRNMVFYLKAHFGDALKLDICAINYYGEPYREYDDTVFVQSAQLSQADKENCPEQFKGGDPFGRLTFPEMLAVGKYDGLFIMYDLGTMIPMLPNLQMVIEAHKLNIRKMIYFPVDGPMHPKVKNAYWSKDGLDKIPKHLRHIYSDQQYLKQLDMLEWFDEVVTYTEYGKSEIEKHRPSLKDRISVIYHGTDTGQFKPIEQKEIAKIRKEYFGAVNAGKFIVGNINRNQYRKDIPATIFGFQHALKIWPKDLPPPFLYLHMNPEDFKGWNLRDLLSQTDLVEGKHYMFPKAGDENYQVSRDALCAIYNCLDVYLTTARGGGWELPVTEAMACKVPCILPDHTSLAEIGNFRDKHDSHRAFPLTELLPVSDTQDNCSRWMCHFEEVGESIVAMAQMQAYKIPGINRRNDVIENAYIFVKINTWEIVCNDWISIWGGLYGIKPKKLRAV